MKRLIPAAITYNSSRMVVATTSANEASKQTKALIKVIEAFTGHQTVDYSSMTKRLLATVPDKYLVGLDSVVICNLSEQPRRVRTGTLRSRGRRVRRRNVCGLYHRAWKGQRAWIQIFADKLPALPRYMARATTRDAADRFSAHKRTY